MNDVDNNNEKVRFSGPISKYLYNETKSIVDAYKGLRSLIQVDAWEPKKREKDSFWVLNKAAFRQESGELKGYREHIYDCEEKANVILKKYQRLQITAELHFYESFFARWLLPKRYKRHNVQ